MKHITRNKKLTKKQAAALKQTREAIQVEYPPINNNFLDYKEPIGTKIKIYPYDTPRTRLAKFFFENELFIYFQQLVNGQCGWGISYTTWLEFRGWKLIGLHEFERIKGVEEMITEENDHKK
jgi:hypothetical protein